MERKLASIRTITDIQSIPDADSIEVVSIGGWKVVSKKGEYKVGDMCVYCEIDSFLPILPQYEFLRKSSYKKMSDGTEGFRLKTIKLRGQVSQGLVLPITVLPGGRTLFDGMDVTDVLGITKYEPPIPSNLSGQVKGHFPSFLQKTDEERVQNLADVYPFNRSLRFYVTEKLDGSSATFYFKDGVFGVCSRNLELLETPDNTFWKVARHLKIEESLRELGQNMCLQGELIGEGIQGNPYKIKGQTVKFFNAFNIDEYRKLSFTEFSNLMNKLNLETVPVLNENFNLPEIIDELLLFTEGKSLLNPNTEREGLVIRSQDISISFKAISNKFLLKEK
jgi:RNA ligase (TIGR02306 family)